jgi:hypothetical protein
MKMANRYLRIKRFDEMSMIQQCLVAVFLFFGFIAVGIMIFLGLTVIYDCIVSGTPAEHLIIVLLLYIYICK